MGLFRQFLDGSATLHTCLRRIARHDAEVEAWVEVAPQPALGDGPLRGIPFGAKDIFETRGLSTAYGSPLYAGRKGDRDAVLVERLRRHGAILLGKTHTTAFAYFDPAPTRNPRNLAHTPGGSSSGSAAAVAAGMVPFALGTQTQGSVLRPAAYCGVVGFKPTFGLLPLDGVLPFAPTLDTAGLFTEDPPDLQALWERMGYGRADLEATVEPGRPTGLDELLETVRPAARLINHYEGARTHEARWREHGAAIGAKLAALVEEGLRVPEEAYQAARAILEQSKAMAAELFERCPLIATPAAPGPAPLGLESTGDPRMNAPWTALGVPAITVPLAVPPGGLPLGLQLTAAWGRDAFLVAAAAKIHSDSR
ncbi:MAG: amidase [Acidobacteria bacterium]|nr:amidase [Acidobacteriota bacterium]